MIQDERITILNDADVRDRRYVLYWMQHSQRAACNHALEFAVRRANELGLPLLAVFGITQRFPGASERAYAFMLEGLRETARRLGERGVRLVVRLQPPFEAVRQLAGGAALVVCDRGYLRVERSWRKRLAQSLPCRLVEVEADVIVPVETASAKEEYAARTIRPKIHEQLDRFLVPLEETNPERDSSDLGPESVQLEEPDALLEEMRINRDAPPSPEFRGGTERARALLDEFIEHKLARYHEDSNDPSEDALSQMSPYLHFGQVSPLEVALAVRDAKAPQEAKDAYLEQLIVRRELAVNLCHYNPGYDDFACLPDWAQETLREHADDKREYVYERRELERAETHDPCWNAAQREMVARGKMHGYMRMYWGKKILEWVPDPREAYRTALEMNDRWEFDGRDPNGYAGVAWCFGKHDQGWAERPIFGKVRYMNRNGLERKFDMDAYVERVNELAEDGS
jgi:deoxyribodipyrimidine photo-lyase